MLQSDLDPSFWRSVRTEGVRILVILGIATAVLRTDEESSPARSLVPLPNSTDDVSPPPENAD